MRRASPPCPCAGTALEERVSHQSARRELLMLTVLLLVLLGALSLVLLWLQVLAFVLFVIVRTARRRKHHQE